MRRLLAICFTGFFLVMAGCQRDTTMTGLDENVGPLSGPSFLKAGKEKFDMNDRFATETGASGSGKVNVHDGSVKIKVKAKDLLPNHQYELKVSIGPGGDPTLGGFNPTGGVVTFGPVTSGKHGKIKFKVDLDLLGLLGPGLYRLDLFVTHTDPTVPGSGGVGEFLTTLLDRDPLLACEPAPSFITV